MTAPTIRCEKSWCDEAASIIASRVDASRDYTYRCEAHRIPEPTVYEQSTLPRPAAELAALTQPRLSLELTLAMWPPKHRAVTRREAAAIVEAYDR